MVFISLTLIFYPVFIKKTWAAMLSIAFVWEIVEFQIVLHVTNFPFVGKETFINKCVGDPISNFLGFIIAMYLIKKIKEGK